MTCWCGRPSHNDLIDGCVGDGLLRMLFGPPSVESMISSSIQMYGDLLAMAIIDSDEEAKAFIAANPLPGPNIETDKAILRSAGMNVSEDDIRSIRRWYWPELEETG